MELLHGWSDLVSGLDIHNGQECAISLYLLHSTFYGQGNFDDGIVVRLLSHAGTLLRVFGLPLWAQSLGARKDE